MPRLQNTEDHTLSQIKATVATKHVFLLMYDDQEQYPYLQLDEINEVYLKLLDSYTSDSFQIFKSHYDGSPTTLVYLNEDGSIDPDLVLYLEDFANLQNSVSSFVH